MKRGKYLLYPERKRCFKCRSYFGFVAYQGLYCSRACAGMPPVRQPVPSPYLPGERVLELPRCCRTVYDPRNPGRAHPKIRWQSEQDAKEIASECGNPNVYQCEHCGYWHLGTWHPPV